LLTTALGRHPLLGQKSILLRGELLHRLGGAERLWLPRREGGLLLLPGLPQSLELLGGQRRLLHRLHLLLHGLTDRRLLGVLLTSAALHLASAAATASAALRLAPTATTAAALGRRRAGTGA